jgi:plastocyanin
MRARGKVIWTVAAVAAIAMAAACGDDDGNPGGPSGGGGTGGGGGGTAGTTVTITSSGVNPKNITVAIGTQVTFVNSDTRSHEMASNPHPTHGSCPEIENGVGFINIGQTKQTSNFTSAKTCGYHDHNRDTDASLQGTITVQ